MVANISCGAQNAIYKLLEPELTMPSINVVSGAGLQGKSGEILRAIQSAMEIGLGVPDWDRDIALNFYEAAHRYVPIGKDVALYTRIEIILYEGRTVELKHQLYRQMIENFAKLDIPAGEVKIILIEMPRENWGIGGRL